MKPECELIGQDGNVFNIIGIVSKTLKRDGNSNKAKEFSDRALNCESYDEVLNIVHEYVEVK